MICDGDTNAYSLNHSGESLTLGPSPPRKCHKIKSRTGSKSSLFMREQWVMLTTTKRKARFALLMAMPNKSCC